MDEVLDDQTWSSDDGTIARRAYFEDVIGLRSNEIGDDDLLAACDLSEIEEIDLDGNRNLTFRGFARIGRLQKLQKLHLSHTNVDGLVMQQIGKCSGLRVLDITATELSDEDLRPVGMLTNLVELGLLPDKITWNGIKYLRGLEHLGEFRFYEPDDSGESVNEGMKAIATMRSLRLLDLSGSAVADDNLECLATLENLVELRLANCEGITNDGLKSLGAMRQLQILDLHGCDQITNEGLESLLALPRLHELHLSGCAVLDGAEKMLMRMKGLKELTIGSSGISDQAVLDLQRALPHCKIHSDVTKWMMDELLDELRANR